MESFSIGDLASEFGVTLRALRFYEEKGLLHPRRQGQSRVYSRRDRSRLRLILTGKRVGFTLGEIRDMLDLYDLKGGDVAQLKHAAETFHARIESLKAQRACIDEAIGDLTRTYEIVSGMLKEQKAKSRGPGPL